MKNKRKICVITGSRAEYGLLYWILKEIDADPALELQLVVTGMHLSKEFGETYKEIERDGFKISKRVELLLSSDTKVGTSKSIGLGIINFSDVFENLQPDLILVLGDRFEIFAAVQAAFVQGFLIAHIHGGELTLGATDEGFRHAITKMAHFHFASHIEYGKRIRQLGEDPENIYVCGAPGLDNIAYLDLDNQKQLETRIGLEFGDDKLFLVTYLPETLGSGNPKDLLTQILTSLDSFPSAKILFTKSNADAGGHTINQMIDDYVQKNKGRAVAHTSLGQKGYLSALKHSDLVIGNSSSGIIEAPYFNIPTINIGIRQEGRIFPSSIISTSYNTAQIIDSINHALSSEWKKNTSKHERIYGVPGKISMNIKNIIKGLSLNNAKTKKFFDINERL